jgi:hypothetical protein
MTTSLPWHEANQRYLSAALEGLRARLEGPEARDAGQLALAEIARSMPAPAAVERLVEIFGLSSFERDILLLCAGVELDAGIAALVGGRSEDARDGQPTFGLALATLTAPHWSALSPGAPLRHWRLVEGDGPSPTRARLRIDERILHHVAGVNHLDERLVGFVRALQVGDDDADLLPSRRRLADRLAVALSSPPNHDRPGAALLGGDPADKRAVATAACASLGLGLLTVDAAVLPSSPPELDALLRLLEREAALVPSAVLLDCDDADRYDGAREATVARTIDTLRCPLIVTSRERRGERRPLFVLEVPRPSGAEQRLLWQELLARIAATPEASAAAEATLDALVGHFDLSAPAIRAACRDALTADAETGDLPGRLWLACRDQARPRLDELAGRVDLHAGWDDLVLPEAQRRMLREIVIHVRQRRRVYGHWGFAEKGARGLGISALFAGASGTGKTLAAEVLATTLSLDLYRIDLSQVVSKYIGETEKNLRRVFDAAEAGGAVLLFDEADALFGRRSEVKDSHDRYANIEVSYLLQRMEAYRGLAILTTNRRDALDPAFLRRLRFVVHFPFPDGAQRAEIWRRAFPARTPLHDLDVDKLARLNVPGGNIRNIALHAAFLAADEDAPVGMAHLLRAARAEYGKLERSPTEAEIGGWT